MPHSQLCQAHETAARLWRAGGGRGGFCCSVSRVLSADAAERLTSSTLFLVHLPEARVGFSAERQTSLKTELKNQKQSFDLHTAHKCT